LRIQFSNSRRRYCERIDLSAVAGKTIRVAKTPDCAALHPGYE
jgi:hypothetical protein